MRSRSDRRWKIKKRRKKKNNASDRCVFRNDPMLCGFACDDAFSKSCRCQGGRKSICDPGIYTGAGCSCLAAYVTFLVKRSKKDLKEIIELEYSKKEQEQV